MASRLPCSLVCLVLTFVWYPGFTRDRTIPENLVFPPQAFFRNGGNRVPLVETVGGSVGIIESEARGMYVANVAVGAASMVQRSNIP